MQLFSAFGAATALEVDRQTIARALRRVKPDAYEKKSPRWRLPKIIQALEPKRHAGRGYRGYDPELRELADQIEVDFKAFDAGFAQLEAEPNLARRRKLDQQLGVGEIIGGLDRQIRQANAAIGQERSMGALVGDHLIGDLIS